MVRRVRRGGVGGGIGDIVLFEREDGVRWCTRVLEEGDERCGNALDTVATFFFLLCLLYTMDYYGELFSPHIKVF
jgi:hypothetical protein